MKPKLRAFKEPPSSFLIYNALRVYILLENTNPDMVSGHVWAYKYHDTAQVDIVVNIGMGPLRAAIHKRFKGGVHIKADSTEEGIFALLEEALGREAVREAIRAPKGERIKDYILNNFKEANVLRAWGYKVYRAL